jgi:hypothetical protein
MIVNTIKNLANNVVNKHKNFFPKLCTPAKIEYIIALIATVSLSISCLTETSGSTFNDVCAEILPYILTAGIYIWILQSLCKGGASTFAWIIVLSPIIVLVTKVLTKTLYLKSELYDEEESFDVVDQMLKSAVKGDEDYDEDDDEDEDEDEDEEYDDDEDEEDFEDPDEDEDFKKIFDGTN